MGWYSGLRVFLMSRTLHTMAQMKPMTMKDVTS